MKKVLHIQIDGHDFLVHKSWGRRIMIHHPDCLCTRGVEQ